MEIYANAYYTYEPGDFVILTSGDIVCVKGYDESAKTYTVTFNKNCEDDVTLSKASMEVTYDGTYGDLATATRSGYDFAGWFDLATGGNQITSSTSVKITENKTLYAVWQRNEGVY